MKKNLVGLLVCVLIGGLLASCNKKDETIDTTLIFGLWQEQEEGKMEGDHMRFLNEAQEAKEDECFFGKEWDEDDDVYEDDLVYKGNGWFKWEVKDNTTLYKYAKMDWGWSDIPKVYTIKTLNSTQLVLQETNDKDDVETWIRQ